MPANDLFCTINLLTYFSVVKTVGPYFETLSINHKYQLLKHLNYLSPHLC